MYFNNYFLRIMTLIQKVEVEDQANPQIGMKEGQRVEK